MPVKTTDYHSMRYDATPIWRMNLEHLTDRPLDVLSGGEKQRVAIASAYAMQPSIGLMPFQGGCVYIGGTKLSGRKLRQHVYYCFNDTGTQFFTISVLEELLLDKKVRKEICLLRARSSHE